MWTPTTCPICAVGETARRGGLLPLSPRPGNLVAALGRSGNAGVRAPHRRPGEGGRYGSGQLRRRPTISGWSRCGVRRSSGLPAIFPRPRSWGRRRAICWWSAGAAPTAPLPPPSTKCGRPGGRVAHLHLRYLNPFPANLGSILANYRRILVAGEQYGATPPHAPRPVPRGRPSGCAKWKAGRSASGRFRSTSNNCWENNRDDCQTHRKAASPRSAARRAPPLDARRLPVFPGGQMVSRLRGLRHPGAGAEGVAAAGHPPREDRVHFRDRLLVAVPLLPEHLRDAQHPRAGAGDRHGPEMCAAGVVRVGRHRRRRRLVDRHKSHDPLHAAQPGRQHPAVQQPDLRLDQGTVLADLRVRQEDEIQSAGHDRAADPSDRAGAGRRSDVCRPHGRLRPGASGRDDRGGGAPSGDVVRGNPAELRRFQRQRAGRSSATAPCATTIGSAWSTASRSVSATDGRKGIVLRGHGAGRRRRGRGRGAGGGPAGA